MLVEAREIATELSKETSKQAKKAKQESSYVAPRVANTLQLRGLVDTRLGRLADDVVKRKQEVVLAHKVGKTWQHEHSVLPYFAGYVVGKRDLDFIPELRVLYTLKVSLASKRCAGSSVLCCGMSLP